MTNHDAEAHRHFQSLTVPEQLEEVWFGMRELRALGVEMLQRQDKTNGHVQHTKEELAAHLEAHEKEETEIAFLKRWGGRGTAIIIAAIAVAGTLAGLADRFW